MDMKKGQNMGAIRTRTIWTALILLIALAATIHPQSSHDMYRSIRIERPPYMFAANIVVPQRRVFATAATRIEIT